jgi:hypothetical protein
VESWNNGMMSDAPVPFPLFHHSTIPTFHFIH